MIQYIEAPIKIKHRNHKKKKHNILLNIKHLFIKFNKIMSIQGINKTFFKCCSLHCVSMSIEESTHCHIRERMVWRVVMP